MSDAVSTPPIGCISKGHFAAERYEDVRRLIEVSAGSLVPAIKPLGRLLYCHVGVDLATNTVVNVNIWNDPDAAKKMGTLAAILAQRPVLE
jgi:hypothetical protein